jgi:hypothetical protein
LSDDFSARTALELCGKEEQSTSTETRFSLLKTRFSVTTPRQAATTPPNSAKKLNLFRLQALFL